MSHPEARENRAKNFISCHLLLCESEFSKGVLTKSDWTLMKFIVWFSLTSLPGTKQEGLWRPFPPLRKRERVSSVTLLRPLFGVKL